MFTLPSPPPPPSASMQRVFIILFSYLAQPQPLVFGSSDLHDGTRVDLPSILQHLGQRFVLMGTKGRASPYPEVFDLDGVSIYENLSGTLKTHVDHTSQYTPADIQEHVEYYKSG
jgi:hypothetical protein